MRFIKFLIVFIIVIAAAGVGIYYVGTNMASEKIVEEASAELADSGQLDELKTYVEEDPQLSRYIEEARTADKDSLPFTSKGEATRVLIQKVGISELKAMQNEVQNGTMSKEEVIQKLETELTEDELLALKVIAYEELYTQK